MSPTSLLRRLALAGWFSLALASGAPAQEGLPPLTEDYVLRVWETDDGLPQNSVSGIAQTPDGYLWLATWGGLARFDGVRFTTFFKGSTPGLESNYVRTVATDRTGDLWIGVERGGVARRHAGRFEMIAPVAPAAALTSWVTSFAEDAGGAVWFGLAPEPAARRWQRGVVAEFGAKEGIGPGTDTFLQAGADGRIWFATKQAGGLFDGARFQPVDAQGGDRVKLAPARAGGMWAVRGNALLRYGPDGVRDDVADLAWLGGAVEVNVLFEDRAGDLWLGTRGAGLFRFRAGGFVRVPTSHKGVLSIAEDREGNLWVGTLGGGLNRLRPRRIFLRDVRHGIEREGILSLCEDTAGRLWLAVRDLPPVRGMDAANSTFAAAGGSGKTTASVLSPDPRGGVWLGDSGGLMHWRDGVFTRVPLQQRVAAMHCDREGNVWIGPMRGGLVRFHEGEETAEPADGGLTLVRAIAEDADGRIWAGTDAGRVFRREGKKFVPVPLPGTKADDQIRFLVADEGGTMWIGARDGGLLRWRSGRVNRLPEDAGLRCDDLRSLLIEPGGNFWVTRGGSLFRTTRSEVNEVLDGRRRVIRGLTYGRDDGLPANVGFAFGRRNAAVRTRDGHLWFATDRGAIEIKPQPLRENVPLLAPQIEEMRLGGQPLPLDGGRPVLPPQPADVEIRFTVPQLGTPERLRLRHRLAGLEEGWTAAQNERAARFARLPPGEYRLEIAASEVDHPERPEVVAALPFTVRAAWWETLAFRATAIGLGALGLAALVRMLVLRRVHARIRRIEQEHALEKERTRIARDMHDEVGASLTRLALMSELAADEPEMHGAPARQLGEIAQAARTVSSTLDQIVWTVNPRNDTLDRLIGYLGEFAAEYLAPTGLELRLELPAEAPAQVIASEVRHGVLLATKEALNNVAKHAHARHVTLRVTLDGGTLRVVIADDGRGFDPAAVGAFSNGLTNLRQRLAALGGTADIASRPGAGTTVTLSLPIAPA